jgi:ubiquinol-cytochrome c reductase cytochrome c1 subunit
MLRKALAPLAGLGAALGIALVALPASAAKPSYEHREVEWSFAGPFGKFDTAQLQRGYKVYREVCSACHSMNLLYFRNLGQKAGRSTTRSTGTRTTTRT